MGDPDDALIRETDGAEILEADGQAVAMHDYKHGQSAGPQDVKNHEMTPAPPPIRSEMDAASPERSRFVELGVDR